MAASASVVNRQTVWSNVLVDGLWGPTDIPEVDEWTAGKPASKFNSIFYHQAIGGVYYLT